MVSIGSLAAESWSTEAFDLLVEEAVDEQPRGVTHLTQDRLADLTSRVLHNGTRVLRGLPDLCTHVSGSFGSWQPEVSGIGALLSNPTDQTDFFTITITTFTVTQGATPVPGAVTYVGTVASLNPTSDLAAGIEFTATITTPSSLQSARTT
jgi:hypothetical protein